MIIKEFGAKDKPILILIHGGGLSWWSWKKHIEYLEKDYSIRAVIIDGHGEDSANDFVSIEHTAQQILAYIEGNELGQVHGICGLSIGAQITVELLTIKPELAEHWLIESALVIPLGKMVQWALLIIEVMYPLVKKKWYARVQAKSLCIQPEDFDNYYEDSKKMSLNTLKAVTLSNSTYTLKQSNIVTTSKVLIFVGSKEPKVMVQSAKVLSNAISHSQLEILPGYQHGAFSLQFVEQYLGVIRRFGK